METAAGAAQAVAMVGLTVGDMDRSIAFYTSVLEFQKLSDDEVAGSAYEKLEDVFGVRMRVVRLGLGDEQLQLTEYLAPRGRPAPADSRSNDRWFQHVAIVVSDMDSAYARLRRNKVQHASTGPQLLPTTIPAAAGIRAFYFRDPDGHPLELLQFPPDKGNPKWHAPADRLFLGIDHTAIVVADTDKSVAFYRDRLGLKAVGGSENWGDEQEHLNNVFVARLRITTLRADGGGPGVELLEYLAPRDGRPYPTDARPNDLFHWQTTVRARPSAGPASLVRDPDGHAVQLVQE
jgi:catechol 2,3-dioxygenase-like lactoylglutathione lyase family enzyme